MALKTLTSARTALETVRGTSLTCTRILYGSDMTWEQEVSTILPDELRGSYFQTFRAYPGIETNTFNISADVTYDDLIWWGQTAVKGGVSPTGAGADRTWTYTPSGTTDDLKSFTLECGWTDVLSTVGWRLPGCMVDTFRMKWEKAKGVSLEASVKTFKAATQITSFTGALSDRTNVSALGTLTKVYIDATTIGSTQDTTVTSAEFEVDNGLSILYALDNTAVGQSIYRPRSRKTTLKLTRYFNSKAELDPYLAKTERKIRILTTGPSLGSSNYSVTLDFYGIADKHTYSEADDQVIEEITYNGYYDTGASTDYSLVVVGSLTSIS